MDENKKPALPEIELPAAASTELPAVPSEESELPVQAEDAPMQAEPPEDAAPDLVFGMKRRTFHLMVIGYALGAIVIGLLGIAGLVAGEQGTVLPGTIGAMLGYVLAKFLDRRDADRASTPPKP